MPPSDEYPTVINTRPFDADWQECGLDDADLARLQQSLAANPEAGSVVPGAGGLRKVRFAPPGAGKSGGVRVCYAHFAGRFVFLMVAAYGKSRKSNLTVAEKKAAAALIREFDRHLPAARPPRPAGNGGES